MSVSLAPRPHTEVATELATALATALADDAYDEPTSDLLTRIALPAVFMEGVP